MDSQSQANCREWCKSHYWQLQEKRGWRYQFRESTMVRYYEEAHLDPTLLEPLVEFLKGDGWQACCTVHNKPIDATGWKTRDVWYETRDGDVKADNKLKRTRIYHAFYKENGEAGGDGPYVMENGCKWKVSHTFHWRVASLPAVPQGESGVQYRLQGVTRDDETGLWSCVVEKRETVRQDIAEYGTAETVFEKRSEEQHLGVKQSQVASTGKQASAGGGKMVRRQVRKNEDCTSDVTNETVEERPVAGAVEETTRLARGTRTVTVNRNQANKAGLGEAASVRNERTDGGFWTQTITTFARILGRLRATCRKTIFLHEHAETVIVDEDPGFQHVETAGGGVTIEKTVTRNDENGFDVETRRREEQSVPGAVVETQKFVDGVTVTTVNRGQAAAASASGLKIGERVRNEKTEGGLIDQTIVQASVEPVGRKEETCEESALVHAHSRTEGMGTQPQAAELPEPGNGQIATRRVRMTERGAWDVTNETRTAKPAQADGDGGSQGRRTHVTDYRNASEINPGAGGQNEDVAVSVRRNEFGLLDGQVQRTTYEKASGKSVGKGALKAKQSVTATRNDPDQEAGEEPGKNKTVEVSLSPNDHGTFEKTVRVTQFEEATAIANGGTMLYDEERTVKTNTEDAAPRTPTKGTVYDVTAEPNDHGTTRLVVVKRTAREANEGRTWTCVEEGSKKIQHWNRGVFVYLNQKSIVDPEGEWDTRTLSLRINEYGLLDYTWTCATLTSEEDAGGSGSGSAGTDSGTRTVRKYYQKKDGKTYMRPYEVHFTLMWGGSSEWLAKQLKGAEDYPELGFRSGPCGNGIYVKYTSCQPGQEQGPLSESQGGSQGGGNG